MPAEPFLIEVGGALLGAFPHSASFQCFGLGFDLQSLQPWLRFELSLTSMQDGELYVPSHLVYFLFLLAKISPPLCDMIFVYVKK